jgi:hypothetical protein
MIHSMRVAEAETKRGPGRAGGVPGHGMSDGAGVAQGASWLTP